MSFRFALQYDIKHNFLRKHFGLKYDDMSEKTIIFVLVKLT